MESNPTPQFCRKCGTRLQSNVLTTEYDPFTGDAINHTSLYCPNPTVETGRLGAKSVTNHPSWNLSDDGWKETAVRY